MKAIRTKKAPRRAAVSFDTAEFDRELVVDTFTEAPAEARRSWRSAKRRRGRPRKGAGARVVSISVERGLLAKADGMARRLGITRAELVARGLRAALAAAGA